MHFYFVCVISLKEEALCIRKQQRYGGRGGFGRNVENGRVSRTVCVHALVRQKKRDATGGGLVTYLCSKAVLEILGYVVLVVEQTSLVCVCVCSCGMCWARAVGLV